MNDKPNTSPSPPGADDCSVSRTDLREYVDKLQDLFRKENENKFQIGDLIVYLIDDEQVGCRELARWLSKAPSTISEYYRTAKMFRDDQRNGAIPFSRYFQAHRMVQKFHCEPQAALAEIQNRNLNQSRDISRYFAQQLRLKENAEAQDRSVAMVRENGELVNRCHLDDCLNLISRIPDRTVRFCPFDPPYGRYLELPDGHYGQSGTTPCACDHASTAEALDLMRRFLPAVEPKLADHGVILMFRPSGNIDPYYLDIKGIVERAGLVIKHEPIWDKGTSKLGDGKSPYTVGSERIWVIGRRGDKLINHDGSSTHDVLRFAPVPPGTDQTGNGRVHYFMKPLDLCEFLIGKHSYEGELVFEPCGCSGNFSIAAHRLKRNFIYCEINKDNYALGSQRIYQAMQEPPVSNATNGEKVMSPRRTQRSAKPEKKLHPCLFSSQRTDWETPAEVFDPLNKEFTFDLDVCATPQNTKCCRYFTPQEDGLRQPWQGTCWMNPPYGDGISNWMEKAYKSSWLGATVVCLVPVRSTSRWWNEWVRGKGEVDLLPRRIRFVGANSTAPFCSATVVYRAQPYPVGDLEYELNVWGADRINELAPWMIPYAAQRVVRKVG